MKTDELRKRYLDYFKRHGHKVYPSDSLVPVDDPSLLFTGAGMNQFKPYFLGLKKDVKRAASCQKCLRTADLERVGKTAYHHSFFEMLGNFSFGDYFKEEAIAFGWEFVTGELGFPKDELWVSVYEEDNEAFDLWKRKVGLSESRIVRMGPEDNFWPSNAPKDGPNGPCGPCSEIYVGKTAGKGVEIWNLVFTQFDRQSDGSLKNLPQRNIDTGMGLERTAAVLQRVDSNFDTDLFQKIRGELKRLLRSGSAHTAHENAVMDHVRAVTFAVADGALPSNEGRGYVIRKIIRLASDHLQQAGVTSSGSLHKLIPVVVGVYGGAYPEIAQREKTISAIVENEERAFLEIMRTRVPEFVQLLKRSDDPAKLAFTFYDTYGVPREVIQSSAAANGISIPQEAFEAYLNEQKDRSRQSSKITGEIFSGAGIYSLVEGLPETLFLGYESTDGEAKVLRVIKGRAVAKELALGEEGLVFFDRTPFYGESGGQIGDTGKIEGAGFSADVQDAQWIDRSVAHKVIVRSGKIAAGAVCRLTVETARRADIMKNHTATHLLHSALRKTLGDHVKQSGSLVAEDHLRFDFTHFSAVDKTKLAQIEALVNAEIKKNTRLDKRVMTKDEAVKNGAIAFFGEKYGDTVRVVSVGDFSKELCGGTHLESTGSIGLFKIVSESSIQAGVRRIEAVTGRWAESLAAKQDAEILSLCREFSATRETLSEMLKKLTARFSMQNARLTNAALLKLRAEADRQMKNAPEISGVKYIMAKLPSAGVDLLQKACEHLRVTAQPFVLFWLSRSEDKVSFIVASSPDLAKKGFHSGKLVKEIAGVVGGNGGGRPDFAVGGGKDLSKVAEAYTLGTSRVKEELEVLGAKT